MNLRRLPHATVLKGILWLAILLRLAGVVLNTEANDDHLTVIKVMAYQHRIPADDEFWQAYQPKLYHGTVAAVFRALPPLGNSVLVRVGQAISCAAGIATLLILLSVLRSAPVPQRVQQLTFALTALNPKMIATSIEVTNDAFVILFATIAFSAGWRFFRSPDRRQFLLMTLGAALAGVSKGNGLAVSMALGGCFLAALCWPPAPRPRLLAYGALFVLFVGISVSIGGQYWSRYRSTGNPFTINEAYMPPPHFLEETFVRRPGVTSVVNSFMTFRLVGMLQDPQITNDAAIYPPHRTSFWSAVYGSMHSIHYDYFPPSWQTHNAAVRMLLRAIFLLALLPTAALVLGVWSAVATPLRKLLQPPHRPSPEELLIGFGAAGYLAFLLTFAYHERDFGSMKPIYVFPGVLPFMLCAAGGFERLRTGKRAHLGRWAMASGTLLCVAYVLDEAALFMQLTALRLHLI